LRVIQIGANANFFIYWSAILNI